MSTFLDIYADLLQLIHEPGCLMKNNIWDRERIADGNLETLFIIISTRVSLNRKLREHMSRGLDWFPIMEACVLFSMEAVGFNDSGDVGMNNALAWGQFILAKKPPYLRSHFAEKLLRMCPFLCLCFHQWSAKSGFCRRHSDIISLFIYELEHKLAGMADPFVAARYE